MSYMEIVKRKRENLNMIIYLLYEFTDCTEFIGTANIKHLK
jgi:hypothetical protein